jgi:hypothetical protein
MRLIYFSVFDSIKNGKQGLRTPIESFFKKIRNIWAWAYKLGWNFMRHLGYFWPNYKHYFGTVSPLSMGKCSFGFLDLKHITPKCSQNKILAVKNLGNSVHTSVFGDAKLPQILPFFQDKISIFQYLFNVNC